VIAALGLLISSSVAGTTVAGLDNMQNTHLATWKFNQEQHIKIQYKDLEEHGIVLRNIPK
jgi:hypothetical protein